MLTLPPFSAAQTAGPGGPARVDAATLSWTDTNLQPFHAVGEGAATGGTCTMASPWTTLPDGTACLLG